MVDRINLGIIGINEGNGHPFSFAAIINGFDPQGMKESGWDVIYNYLKIRDASEFGFHKVQVTHAWTQDPEQTKKLARASRIPNIVADVHDMLDEVDGVIIARDDYETHYPLAKAFLEKGKFVFIDKPLSLDTSELKFFKKYLENGKLMSCAGARYARELDEIRGNIDSFGELKLVRGTVVNSLEKYGIHMLDGIFSVTGFQAKSVSCFDAKHTSMMIRNKDDSLIFIDALGSAAKTLQFDFWSDTDRFHAETNDNFTMFRRLLADFVLMMRTGRPAIDPELVLNSMKVLIAANISRTEGREVEIDEIAI
ncbi:oxidoreductase [Halieaceae bacterium IMCC14734]|uniref:Oxidoreductase n=1 Tax=Candidatus Litorirhabdus singularis TaxID=2518993 RepID=A0ABT3TIG2_9GAMM|nr:Gfo/Idh/MocA family oxidoreductase [Candidatus Litorirhabdus singularis]MCX2982120.1 oxidoreductase [Candidatus Litorirhabdus singularis]